MDQIKEQQLDAKAQEAFEALEFHGYAICDKLRDMQWTLDSELESGRGALKDQVGQFWRGEGVSFAENEDEPEQDSVKISFHCIILEDRGELTVTSAYAYECGSGQEIANLVSA